MKNFKSEETRYILYGPQWVNLENDPLRPVVSTIGTKNHNLEKTFYFILQTYNGTLDLIPVQIPSLKQK